MKVMEKKNMKGKTFLRKERLQKQTVVSCFYFSGRLMSRNEKGWCADVRSKKHDAPDMYSKAQCHQNQMWTERRKDRK